MNVPADARKIQDSRLTLFLVIKALHDGLAESLKDKIKEHMIAKEAKYAESDYAIARLQNGAGSAGWIKASDLYRLVTSERITLAQFLFCVKVSKGQVDKVLAPDEVNAILTPSAGGLSEKSLVPEFAQGVIFNEDKLAEALLKTLEKSQPAKAA